MMIQLTDYEDGFPCLVQTDAIVYAVMEKAPRVGLEKVPSHTVISFGMDAFVRVRETPAEIIQIMTDLMDAEAAEFEATYDPEEDSDGC